MTIVRTLVMMALVFCTSASAAIFNFEDVDSFTTVPFSVDSGIITANFFSPEGPVFFVATTSSFASLTGNVLVDSDPALNELRILFSEPLQTVSLAFALNSQRITDQFTLQAFLAGASVGSTSATGTVPGGAFTFAEGTISFNSGAFDELRLTSNATDFAVDNINVSQDGSPIPEPSSAWLGAAGIAVMGAALKRRNTQN